MQVENFTTYYISLFFQIEIYYIVKKLSIIFIFQYFVFFYKRLNKFRINLQLNKRAGKELIKIYNRKPSYKYTEPNEI